MMSETWVKRYLSGTRYRIISGGSGVTSFDHRVMVNIPHVFPAPLVIV
ncbi:MAG: hypothetical protein H5U03_03320, partial [Clostridia bacterium]|nr:hypothetical protein [Clostridia bacterium]